MIAVLWMVAPGKASSIPTPTSSKTFGADRIQQTAKLKKEGLTVQLQSCVREGQSVQCTLFLSSRKDELTVWVTHPNRAKSRLIDQSGNEYGIFQIVRFGMPHMGTMVVREAPIKLVVQFDQLPSTLTRATLVEIGLETYGRELPVRFKDVNLPNGVFQFQPSPAAEMTTQSGNPGNAQPVLQQNAPQPSDDPNQPTSAPEQDSSNPRED